MQTIVSFPRFDTDPSVSIWKKKDPKHHNAEVEESKEEFKYVERLIPKSTVPIPTSNEPTPSGWVGPQEKSKDLPYCVRRTRYHNFPVYLELKAGGSRKITLIKFVEGDIWAFEAELREFLKSKTNDRVFTAVDEVCQKIRVRGYMPELVTEFLLEKGL